MDYRPLVFGILIFRTMVCSISNDTIRRSTDLLVRALGSYGHYLQYPIHNNSTCLYSEESDCYRLEFRMELPGGRALSARLFVHQNSPGNASLLWPHPSDYTRVDDDWVYFEVTPCIQHVRRSTFHCSVEYSGESFRGELSPFLVISSGFQSRRRRTTSPCVLADRYVYSKDLGKGEAQPLRINVKMCVGECHVNIGTFTNDYARAMYLYHKRKGSHIPDESWKPTCQITAMESINLFIKNETTNIFEETEMENLVVKSCGCLIHNCSSP